MRLWTIEPVASPDDPRWQERTIWRRVVVRAESAAAARVMAAQLERTEDEPSDGNGSASFRSGFEDEKLYWVKPAGDAPVVPSDDGESPSVILAEPRDSEVVVEPAP